MAKQKSMSDGEVNSMAFERLMGDLGKIEAEGMFDEEKAEESPNEGTKSAGMGVTIEIKPIMAGAQTKSAPVVKAKEEDEEETELGD
jgi:hypothetical protein